MGSERDGQSGAAALPDDRREANVERLAPFDPVSIYVFGSRARGDGHEESDVDLLVVLERLDDGRGVTLELRRALAGLPFAKDVVAADIATLARRGDSIGTVYRQALREGAVIYGVDERDSTTWLRYAEEDLSAAEQMVGRRGFAPRWGCFLAQQAAEKAVKAVLVEEETPFPATHDLERLRDLLPTERAVARIEVDLARLSEWATRGRYPGAWTDATKADARASVKTARAVVEAARADLSG